MGSRFQVNEVGQAITEYTRDPSEHARSQAVDSLNTYGVMHDPEAQRELTRKMEDSNLIGKLALAEFDNLNVHVDRTGRRDLLVRRDDLEQITQHTRDYAPTTVLAAQAILKDFGNINAKGGFWDSSGYITKGMIEKWSQERAKLGGVLDPSVVFNDNNVRDNGYNNVGDNGYNNGYNDGFDDGYDSGYGDASSSPTGGALVSNMISRFKAWSDYAGRLAGESFSRNFPQSNADVGPGEVAMNGRAVPAKSAQSGFDGDNYVYTIQSGDTLTSIARSLLEQDGMEATPANMQAKMRYLARRNSIADMDRIYTGKTLQY